jgi:hypothetical protein
MPRRPAVLSVLIASLALLFAAPADAYHPPTETELAEIEAASAHHEGIGVEGTGICLYRPYVSRTDVWAEATMYICEEGLESQGYLAFFHKQSGIWRALPQEDICVPPDIGMPLGVAKEFGRLYCHLARPRRSQAYVTTEFGSEALAVRPRVLRISGDGTFSLYDLRWRSWGGRRAVATGRARDQGCTPDCAEGEVTRPKVTIGLSHLVRCGGRRIYTRLTRRVEGPVPVGATRGGTSSIAPPQCLGG